MRLPERVEACSISRHLKADRGTANLHSQATHASFWTRSQTLSLAKNFILQLLFDSVFLLRIYTTPPRISTNHIYPNRTTFSHPSRWSHINSSRLPNLNTSSVIPTMALDQKERSSFVFGLAGTTIALAALVVAYLQLRKTRRSQVVYEMA